jgi:hypothetical protein
MENFAEGDPAIARYSTLCDAVGGEPVSGFHRALIARLVSWTDAEDINGLAWLIKYHVAAVCQRCRSLLGEIKPYVHAGREVITRDGPALRVELPDQLARRIILQSGEQKGDDQTARPGAATVGAARLHGRTTRTARSVAKTVARGSSSSVLPRSVTARTARYWRRSIAS